MNHLFFVSLLKTMSFVDWIWLTMLFVSGVLLLIQHKMAWVLSMSSLVLVLAINASRFWFGETTSIDPQYYKMFSILSLLSTAGGLTTAYYFRYPYLDLRVKWTSPEQNPDRREYQRLEKSDRRKID
ncbi:MAG: hypothetical protein ACK41T_10495 [Pseudobdellovibrio sp.]